AVQERAVAAQADRVARFVAAPGGDETAAGRIEVALAAAGGPRAELELRVGGRAAAESRQQESGRQRREGKSSHVHVRDGLVSWSPRRSGSSSRSTGCRTAGAGCRAACVSIPRRSAR